MGSTCWCTFNMAINSILLFSFVLRVFLDLVWCLQFHHRELLSYRHLLSPLPLSITAFLTMQMPNYYFATYLFYICSSFCWSFIICYYIVFLDKFLYSFMGDLSTIIKAYLLTHQLGLLGFQSNKGGYLGLHSVWLLLSNHEDCQKSLPFILSWQIYLVISKVRKTQWAPR